MSEHQSLIDWVTECVAPLGLVTWRAMRGGATLYCGGTVFAIIAADRLWFKWIVFDKSIRFWRRSDPLSY